jgi:phosphatidylserine/phosphatidylglycerophosphate/cardiolipin synthase-like enzyme
MMDCHMIPRLPAIKIIFLVVCLIYTTSACSIVPDLQEPISSTSTITQPDWYTIYFTDPSNSIATFYRDGIDEDIAAAIDQARVSVDVAIYDLNLWSIRDALIKAHRSGVDVRVVTESDNLDEQELRDLKDAGIEVLGDRHEGLMHHKFVVIDRSEIWTGSVNFTKGGTYLDNNNLVHIQSTRLAEDYTHEFEQMFVDGHFGTLKSPNSPYPLLNINGSAVEVYFSPQDGTLQHILATVDSAEESIYFLAYSFTSDELADALIQKANSGVLVRGVFDKDQYHSNSGTEFDTLLTAGIDVRLDGNQHLMHHKVIIIDGQIVITGSYNFSNNAEQHNDENTLIIHNQDISREYLAEFERLYNSSQR